MKSIITLCLILVCINGNAQPKRATVAPAPVNVAPAKPKGPIPYMLKKDFEEILIGLKSEIARANSISASLRNKISTKDEQINKMSEDLKKVEEVLNSTNLEIENTSDSLSKTRYSLEELQKMNESHFNKIETKQAENMNMLWIVFGISLLIALICSLIFNMLANKKIHSLKNEINIISSKMESSLESKIKSIKAETVESIRASAEQQQFYSERLSSASKAETTALKSELEKLSHSHKTIIDSIIKMEAELKAKEDTDIV